MRKHLFGTALCACLMFTVGTAAGQVIPIDDIQVYTATGHPETDPGLAPYWGQVVTVEGVIYVIKGTYNSGTHYIQGATGGIQFFDSGAPSMIEGRRVQVTGTVASFSEEIQISPVVNYQIIGDENPPQPTEYAISDLVNPMNYEEVGNFGFCTGTVINKTGNSFELQVGGDAIFVYIDSDTGIDISGVIEGEEITVRSPIVNYAPDATTDAIVELKPRKQSDVIIDPTLPIIENIYLGYYTPEESDPIEVNATITDDVGLSNVQIYYRDDAGDSSGAFTPVAMSNVGGNSWRGTIPPLHTERKVDYYIQATDAEAQTVSNPGTAPSEWYEVAVGFTPIYQMNYVHPDSFSQSSPLRGKVVNARGIVTAGRGMMLFPSQFILQEENPNGWNWGEDDPGIPEFVGRDYRWGGILVYEGTGGAVVFQGDRVFVGGYCGEYNFVTELDAHSWRAVYIDEFGLDLPPPMYVHTRDLADDVWMDDGNGRYGEAFESTWIRTRASTVMDVFDGDRYIISDTGARADSVEVDPDVSLTYVPTIGDVVILQGYMDYYFTYRITPTGDNDVVFGLSGVDDQSPVVLQPAGGFTGIVPNPFNPKTEINFVLNRDNLTQLNIYDIRGQLVKVLVNEMLPAQEYKFFWDGSDLTGQRVSSGTYFARLRIGSEVMQVHKLMMVK